MWSYLTYFRKYIFVSLYQFSHNSKVNICINLYFTSVWELTKTLAHYIQPTKCNVLPYISSKTTTTDRQASNENIEVIWLGAISLIKLVQTVGLNASVIQCLDWLERLTQKVFLVWNILFGRGLGRLRRPRPRPRPHCIRSPRPIHSRRGRPFWNSITYLFDMTKTLNQISYCSLFHFKTNPIAALKTLPDIGELALDRQMTD